MREPSNFRVPVVTPPVVRDDSSSPNAPPRHSVGPYRDSRGALAARLIALGRELEELGVRDERPSTALRIAWPILGTVVGSMVVAFIALLMAALANALARPERSAELSSEIVVSQAVKPARAEQTARLRAAPSPTSIVLLDLDHDVRSTGTHTWEVNRTLIEPAILQTGMRTHTRLIPHERDGRVVGVKIYGIRRESMLARLGLENGDLVVRVNGHDIASPDAALEAYAELETTDAVFVHLERRGRERVHAYRLVP